MGGSQSKTETVYSRFPKETELLDSLKITPAVLERVNALQNAPSNEQLAQQQEIIKQQQQMAQQMHYQYEKEIQLKEQQFHEKMEIAERENQEKIKQMQESLTQQHQDQITQVQEDVMTSSNESASEQLQLLESNLREESSKAVDELQRTNDVMVDELRLESTKIVDELRQEYEDKLAAAQAESNQVRAHLEAQLSTVTAGSISTAVFEETVEETKKRATEAIRAQTEKLAHEQQTFLEKQQREKEEVMAKTQKFFSPNEVKNICGDLTNAVASCYSENPKNTMLCAEVVRQLQSCVNPEKQNYLMKRNLRADSA